MSGVPLPAAARLATYGGGHQRFGTLRIALVMKGAKGASPTERNTPIIAPLVPLLNVIAGSSNVADVFSDGECAWTR